MRITCRYFEGDELECELSIMGDYSERHIACNCDGDINQCDLPEKFQAKL